MHQDYPQDMPIRACVTVLWQAIFFGRYCEKSLHIQLLMVMTTIVIIITIMVTTRITTSVAISLV